MTRITTWSAPPTPLPASRRAAGAPPNPQNDQASRLRALVGAADQHPGPSHTSSTAPPAPAIVEPRPLAWTLAIASGKGGVGKTNLAINLALAFAEAGLNTTLLDGDLGLANADILLGLRGGPHLGDVLDGRRSLDQIAVRVTPGFTLIPGASGIAAMANLDDRRRAALRDLIARAAQTSDLLLFDCGAGIGPGVLALMAAADRTLIVTTPEPPSIADAYALIKCSVTTRLAAQAPSPAISLVVNQASNQAEGERVHARVGAVCRRFLSYELPLAAVVTHDEHVRRAVRDRRPFLSAAPKSPAARSVRNLSGSLIQHMVSDRSIASIGSSGLNLMPTNKAGALTRLLRSLGLAAPATH